MLDIKQVRQNPEAVNEALARRKPELSINAVLLLDEQWRKLLQEEEVLRNERNSLSKAVAQKKQKGEEAQEELERSKAVAEQIKANEETRKALEEEQAALLLRLPNLPASETPDGASSDDNVEVHTWGAEFLNRPCPEVKPHYELGVELGLLDFERGVKVAKSRFSVLRGEGAQLVRALINLMLDTHRSKGYEEICPPFIVNRSAMQGTGQLPKFEEDLFKLQDEDLFLIPTAEVPVTNLYAGEVLEDSDLPKFFTAYTPCFRREAGSAGQDTRGLIRQHQFDKVELVKLVRPQDSEAELEKLTQDAEAILKALELPYRVVALCAGDLGFSAARCYDLEVWMPAQQQYREISSCSNMQAFQARRMNLRYKPVDEAGKAGKPAFLHTLNGSALAVGRTIAAILENYQIAENRIAVPTALQPYLGFKEFAL
jgi:seryl-tRNA synthetase